MVICSLPAGEAVPLTCKTWLESWRRRKEGRDSALVALMGTRGGSPERTCSLQLHLRGVAQSANMDVFVNAYTLGLDKALTAPVRQV